MEEKHTAALRAETECAEHMTRLQQSLAGVFQHAIRLAQLRKQQTVLNEELQASQGETMAVSEVMAGE